MQNVRYKQDSSSLMQTLWGCGLSLMVVLGIVVTLYKLMAPNGWIAGYMGNSFSGGVVALGLLAMCAALSYLVRAATSPRQLAAVADLVVYGFAIAGAMYAFRFWAKGMF